MSCHGWLQKGSFRREQEQAHQGSYYRQQDFRLLGCEAWAVVERLDAAPLLLSRARIGACPYAVFNTPTLLPISCLNTATSAIIPAGAIHRSY